MKEINECNLIHDLLPMYIEELVNEDTKEFVEKHVSSCHITNEERNLDI